VTDPEPRRPGAALRSLGSALSTIVAPTSLVSALLYYFGWSHVYWLYRYLGVDSTVLGFTTGDYLMRAIDGLFVPMTVAAVAGLAALWGHALLRARLVADTPPGALRIVVRVLAGLGLLLTLAGLWSTVTPTFLYATIVLAPLSLAAGVALLTYSLRLRRLLHPAPAASGLLPFLEWAVVFVIIGLSLFWATNDYAVAVGRSRARQVVRELPSYPPVRLYSARSLSLDVPGVTEVRCRDPKAAYQVRYDGLRLLPQSGSQYLLLPAHWNPRTGVAVLLPRTDAIRLEFGATETAPAC
jgi:hypothetical protein